MAPQHPVSEDERVRALAELHILDTPPEERFDRVTRLTQRLFGVPLAFVNMIDRDRQWTKSAQGMTMPDVPLEESICATTISQPSGLVVEDLAGDPRFAQLPVVAKDPRLRFYAGIPLSARGGAQVGTLCIFDTVPRRLSEADQALLRDLALWVEKELNIDEELERAAEVQRALLPDNPPDDPLWDVAAACCPSREIGGDFYDWVRSRHGTVVTLGDVMGKGMPAALVMATVRSALRTAARARTLEEGMEQAGESVLEDLLATESFATVFQARLLPNGEVICVDAGHGYGVKVRRDGGVDVPQCRGFPLGLAAEEHYSCERWQLAGGDMLLIHSDGLLELPGGPEQTAEAADMIRGCDSAAAAVERLLELMGDAERSDDVTVLVARPRS